MLSMVLISITKCTLGPQAQHSKSLGVLLSFHSIPTLNFSSSWASLPQLLSHFSHAPSLLSSSLGPFSLGCLFWFPLLSLSPSLPTKVISSVLAKFSLLLSLFALNSSDASGCALPHGYYRNLPLNHTLKWSYPQFIHLLLKLWGWA